MRNRLSFIPTSCLLMFTVGGCGSSPPVVSDARFQKAEEYLSALARYSRLLRSHESRGGRPQPDELSAIKLDPATGATFGASLWDPPADCTNPGNLDRPEGVLALHLASSVEKLTIDTKRPENQHRHRALPTARLPR